MLDVVCESAPNGFARVEDVFLAEELAATACGYAQPAGFAVTR